MRAREAERERSRQMAARAYSEDQPLILVRAHNTLNRGNKIGVEFHKELALYV